MNEPWMYQQREGAQERRSGTSDGAKRQQEQARQDQDAQEEGQGDDERARPEERVEWRHHPRHEGSPTSAGRWERLLGPAREAEVGREWLAMLDDVSRDGGVVERVALDRGQEGIEEPVTRACECAERPGGATVPRANGGNPGHRRRPTATQARARGA